MKLERNGATISQTSMTTTRDDSRWIGLELTLLLAGLFLLTVLLMTVAIILLDTHAHVSLVVHSLDTASSTGMGA